MENLASHVELSYVKNLYTVYHERALVLKLKRSWKTGEGHVESRRKSWNVKISLQTLSLLCILFRSVSRLVCLDRSIPTLFLTASFVQNNILRSLVQNLSSSKFDEFLSLSFCFCFPRFILGSKIGSEMIHNLQMTFYWYNDNNGIYNSVYKSLFWALYNVKKDMRISLITSLHITLRYILRNL